MSYLLNNQQKFNDVIFENRNKAYGAYAIRSAYGNTVFKSLLLISLFSCSLAAIAYFTLKEKEVKAVIIEQLLPPEISTIFETEKPKPMEPETARQPNQPDPSPGHSSAMATVVSDSTAATTPSQSTVEDLPATTSSLAGTPGGNGNGTLAAVSATPGNGMITEIHDDFGVDSVPEFEGGINALYRFVSSRLKYPEPAVERGKEGTVYVKFVVDEKGRVGNIILRNNLGFGLDEEAKRVVSMIPNFKSPAKLRGKPVKAYYSLPIRFKMR